MFRSFFILPLLAFIFWGSSSLAEEEKKQITVGPVFSFGAFNLSKKGNGSEAKLYTNLNFGLTLSWEYVWTDTWSDQFRLTTIYNDIQNDSDSLITSNKKFLSKLEWTSSYRFMVLNQIKSIFGLYENIYSDNLSYGNINVKKMLTPEWALAYQRYIVTKGQLFGRFLIGAGAVYSPKASTFGYKLLTSVGIGIVNKEVVVSYTSKQYDTYFLTNSSQELLTTIVFKF